MAEITVRQWKLLKALVEYCEQGALFDVIRPFPTGADTYVIYLRGRENMTFRHIGDLDVLCVAGYLDYQFSRHGNQKEFVITKAARQLQILPVNRTEYALQVKQQLILLLRGEALTAALIEVEFIRREQQSRQPNDEAIRRSFWQLIRMVNDQLLTDASTKQVAATLNTLSKWMP